MSAINRSCGAVLSGGQSSRMGQAKHALPLADGRAMIEHVVEALRSACDDVVVLGPAEALPDVRHVHDLRPGLGPLAGIEALLASGIAKQYIVCACDTPLVTADLLRRLLVDTTKLVTVLQVQGRERYEPLPMRIGAEALDDVRCSLDENRRSVQLLLACADREVVMIEEDAARLLCNVNTAAEYEALRRD